jgi:hypothetical protein
MHQSELERILRGEGRGDRRWPPGKAERVRWQQVAEYRRRVENDAQELFRWRVDLHVQAAEGGPQATHERQKVFSPVPLARDLARFSSSLLFAEEPKIRLDDEMSAEQECLDAWLEENRVPELLLDAGDSVASEGGGGLRVVWDDHLSSEIPVITFHPEDSILWSTRHGRYTQGGVIAISHEEEHNSAIVWRLLESHSPGLIERVLYKGGADRLGKQHPLTAGPPQFRELRPSSRTGVDKPTLVRWLNVPGGESDLSGLLPLLDALDEAATVGRVKMRASQPITYLRRFSTRDLRSLGGLPMHGLIAVDDWPGRYLGSERPGVPVECPFPVENLLQTVQPGLEASEHRAYVEHLRELAVTMAGYSLASWGLDREGRADSGTALKLRQVRTLLTRSGKERMARQAIAEACAVALGMMLGRSDLEPLLPHVELSDGMPRDGVQDAKEVATLRTANAISTEEIVRKLHPDWSEERIAEELAKIEGAARREREAAQPPQPTPEGDPPPRTKLTRIEGGSA